MDLDSMWEKKQWERGDPYKIDVAVTKEELDADNGGRGTVEIGIRLPDVGGTIKIKKSNMKIEGKREDM